MKHAADFETEINDTVYGVVITHYSKVRGSFSRDAESDVDYYGYIECEWFLVDENGQEANVPLTEELFRRIDAEVDEVMA